MEVIRDSCWYALLMQTIKFYNVIEPDERCVRLADAEWRLKQRHEAIRKAKAQRGIIVIDPVIALILSVEAIGFIIGCVFTGGVKSVSPAITIIVDSVVAGVRAHGVVVFKQSIALGAVRIV